MMEEIKPKKERKFLKAMGDIALTLFRELVFGIGKKVINKVGNKRQGLVISFVILASTFAIAQFPNTGNKQRLGFQTTGDGLVWRGSISDTASIQPINNQNAWVILDTVNLKMYSFDFTSNVWNLVGGAQGLTMPFDSITFNTAKNGTVGVGEVEYNDTQGSLIQGLKGGNVTNVIGQQLHQRVNNRTGAPLAKGDVVYLAGSQGNRITVAKGLAVTDAFSANTFGVVAESIADNASGFIITEGLITGLNTSALTEDSAVYLSPTVAGALTSTKPQAPQHSVYIGVCVKSNNGSGELFVKIRNGLEMDELHDTRITNPVTGATLYYSGGLWRDTTAALLVSDTASMLIPYLRKLDTITLSNRINTKLNISDTASMLLPYLRDADTVSLSNRINLKLNIADTSAFARDNQISGTSGQVAYFNSSSSVVSDTALRWSAANKSLGINMKTVPSGANLILKNSQEPVRSTVVATQTFGADTTNWTRGAGWTFNGTQAVATAATGALTYTPVLTITSGNAYEITYTLSGYSAGTLTARIGYASYSLPTHNATANVVVLLPTDATGGFQFTTSTFTGNLDNISVVQIANPSSILLMGQDDNSTTNYSPLRMPNSRVIGFGGGAAYTTGTNNTFFGINAGQNTTTGTDNNFFGNNAGQSNTTGFINNFFGLSAGQANTTGAYNNFFGFGAGSSNTTGANNNFFGLRAGISNTTGTNNNFFGSGAGQANTTGFQNIFIGNGSGLNNTTGSANNFLGQQAGGNNTTGEQNNFFGSTAAYNNTTGSNNTIIGSIAGSNNTIGSNNTFISTQAGHVNRRGSNNISIGYRSMYNTTVADTLTGSNNIAFGTNAADNIRAEAAGNVAIGNAVDLPTNNGSNQGVYQNVLFFTGASGTGTTIAAASKAGIKTNAPNRDLEVAGEVRITDLTTDAPTRLVGADADGDLGQVTLGAGLSLSSSSLLADTTFLVTRFDTASMLTPYFRDADTSTLNLTSRFAEKQNILVSGNNIKTVNSNNLLGSGNVSVGTVTNVTIASSTPMSITNSTTTPEISMPAASQTTSGFLQATAFALFESKQGPIALTTTGNNGVATFNNNSLNIPNYTLSGLGGVPTTRTITINSTTQDLTTNRTFNVGTLIGTDTVSLSNRINLKFNTADTSLLNLTSRFAAKLNLSDTASMLTNYLRTGTAASTYLTQSNAASTYLPLTGGTLSANRNNTLTVNSIAVNTSDNTALTVNATSPFYDNTNIGILGTGATVYSSGIGLKGEGTQKDMNGFGTAIGVRGDVNATFANSGGTNGTTYAGYFSNNATVDGNNYGLFVNTSNKGDYGIYQTGTGINYFGSNSTFAGNITANSFVKSLGTSLQFLKADGSVDANTYLTTTVAASTYLPLTGGTLTGTINRQEGSHNESTSTFYYNILNYFARKDNVKENQTAQITFTDRPGTFQYPNAVRTSDIYLMTAHNWNGVAYSQYLDTTLSIVANQDGGRVGISKLNPSYKLDVNGTFNASGNSLIGGTLGVTGATTLSAPLTVNSSAVFNEGSTDSDFRVESDGNNNMVFVDASTDRVGIGTNSPTKTLDVNGELNVLSAGTFGGRLNTNWLERTYSNSTSTSLTVSVNTTWLKLENNSTITLTLPNAADYPGKELHIKNAGTGAVNSLSPNIEPLNSTTIGTAILASGGGKWATLVSDGTYWVIMAGN